MLSFNLRPARQLSTSARHASAALGPAVPPAMSPMPRLLLTCAQSFARSKINSRHPRSHTKHVHYRHCTHSPASISLFLLLLLFVVIKKASQAQLPHISHTTRPLGNSNGKKKRLASLQRKRCRLENNWGGCFECRK